MIWEIVKRVDEDFIVLARTSLSEHYVRNLVRAIREKGSIVYYRAQK